MEVLDFILFMGLVLTIIISNIYFSFKTQYRDRTIAREKQREKEKTRSQITCGHDNYIYHDMYSNRYICLKCKTISDVNY